MKNEQNQPARGPINSIVIGRGNKRVKVDLPRDRDERIAIGNKIKGIYLWPKRADFLKARQAGIDFRNQRKAAQSGTLAANYGAA